MINSRAVIEDFKQTVSLLYGDRLDKVLLYGSRARGDNREDSDFDFIVLLNDFKISSFQETERIISASSALLQKYNALITAKPVTLHRFTTDNSMFFKNVKQDAIVV